MVYPALLPLIRTPRQPVVYWTDGPADLNGLVHFAERQKSGFCACAITFELASSTLNVTYLFHRNTLIFLHIDAVGLSWHSLKIGVTVERGHLYSQLLTSHVQLLSTAASTLKNHLVGRRINSNEKVDMAFLEWLRMQKHDFYLEGISKLAPRWKVQHCVRNYVEKCDNFSVVSGVHLTL